MDNKRKFDFIEGYHNNVFNAKVSSLLDKRRIICDVDFVTEVWGYDFIIMADHKKPSTGDSSTIPQLKFGSMRANSNLFYFIVRCDINEKTGEIHNNRVVVTELKSYKEVKNKNNKQDYVKNQFVLTNDEELRKFFAVETHISFKNKLLNENRL